MAGLQSFYSENLRQTLTALLARDKVCTSYLPTSYLPTSYLPY